MDKDKLIKPILMICGVCVVVWSLFSFCFPELGLDQLKPWYRLDNKKNIIVMGVDSRPDDEGKGRSDTLFVVMFDKGKSNAAILSIPRDTRVKIPGHGWDKINHAYMYGGRELTQRTVEEFLGIKVSNYVTVDFKGFVGLVDAIGGVEVDVEEEMYYYDPWDEFEIDIQPGVQVLDGAKAIQYVRYRDEEGDIGRIRRQQRFLMAAKDKIASGDMLTRVPGLSRKLTSMVHTNLPITDMISLGRVLHGMAKDKKLKASMVPGVPEYIDGISYWLPDVVAMRELMASMQGAEFGSRYKNAAGIMSEEYEAQLERVNQGDVSEENAEALKKEKELEKKKVEQKKTPISVKPGEKVADVKKVAEQKKADLKKADLKKIEAAKAKDIKQKDAKADKKVQAKPEAKKDIKAAEVKK